MNLTEAVLRMARLNKDIEPEDTTSTDLAVWANEWKILVVDEAARAIIGPLLHVAALRQAGMSPQHVIRGTAHV